jgi:MoaA/NifB/PqqE/SkfB family radical SAM enzyme
MLEKKSYPVKVYGEEFYAEPNSFGVLAYIIDRCNYSCPYCYNHFPRHETVMDLDRLGIFVDEMQKQKNPSRFYLDLIGGEPLLHPDIADFGKEMMKRKNIISTVYSNMSFPVEKYLELLDIGYFFIMAWHGLCDDGVFLDKLETLYPFKDKIDVSVMLEPGNLRSIKMFKTIKDKFPDYKRIFLSTLTESDHYKRKYTDEELNFLKYLCPMTDESNTKIVYSDGSVKSVDDNYFFLDPKRANFRRWLCNAGKDFVYVHHDGSIHPCDQDDGMPFGNIYGKWKVPDRPILCNLPECPCFYDTYKVRVFNG